MTWSLTPRHRVRSSETRPSLVESSIAMAVVYAKTPKLRKEIALNSLISAILLGAPDARGR